MREKVFTQNYFYLSISQKTLTQSLPKHERAKDILQLALDHLPKYYGCVGVMVLL